MRAKLELHAAKMRLSNFQANLKRALQRAAPGDRGRVRSEYWNSIYLDKIIVERSRNKRAK